MKKDEIGILNLEQPPHEFTFAKLTSRLSLHSLKAEDLGNGIFQVTAASELQKVNTDSTWEFRQLECQRRNRIEVFRFWRKHDFVDVRHYNWPR